MCIRDRVVGGLTEQQLHRRARISAAEEGGERLLWRGDTGQPQPQVFEGDLHHSRRAAGALFGQQLAEGAVALHQRGDGCGRRLRALSWGEGSAGRGSGIGHMGVS